MAYWQDHPPTHVLVGAYLMGGDKSRLKRRQAKSAIDSAANSNSNFSELARSVAFAGGTSGNKLPAAYRQN